LPHSDLLKTEELQARGKRGAIVVLSEYRQKHRQKDGHTLVTNENGRPFNLPQMHRKFW
jgi:hypothetical protein